MTQKTILLVDDCRDTLRAFSIILRRMGYVVQTSSTVAGAVSLFDASNFDIVMTDLALPNENGIALVRHVRSKRPEVHCLIISGYNFGDDVTLGEELGALHMTKPLNVDKLKELLDALEIPCREACIAG
jgi:DNA-binding NtrC family response regulator